MTPCTTQLAFPFFKKSSLTASFSGGSIVTDGGLLLVRQFDETLGFTEMLAARLMGINRDTLRRQLGPHAPQPPMSGVKDD